MTCLHCGIDLTEPSYIPFCSTDCKEAWEELHPCASLPSS